MLVEKKNRVRNGHSSNKHQTCESTEGTGNEENCTEANGGQVVIKKSAHRVVKEHSTDDTRRITLVEGAPWSTGGK